MNPVSLGIATGVPLFALLGLEMNAFEWLLCGLAWYVIGERPARRVCTRLSGFWSRVWTR
jgi:hypothetical protein